MFCWLFNSPFHKGTNSRRGRIENSDFVFFDNFPHAVIRRIVRNTFVHHLCCAVTERSIHDVAMASDPANICCTPENIRLRMQVEHILMRVGDVREIATCCVHDALWLTSGARGVQQKQQLLRIHWLWWAHSIGCCHQFVIPMITASLHINCITTALHNNNCSN